MIKTDDKTIKTSMTRLRTKRDTNVTTDKRSRDTTMKHLLGSLR